MLILRHSPGKVDLGAGAGQCHVSQPHVLRKALSLCQQQMLFDLIRAEVETGITMLVMKGHAVVAFQTKIAWPAGPQERNEHHWVFEPLAGVDRDNLDECLVAFKAQLRLRFRRIKDLLAIPAKQRFKAGVRPCGLLQQLSEMHQIGQAPFGIRQRRELQADLQIRQRLLEQCLEHRHEALLQPQALQRLQTLGPLQPALRIVHDARNRRVIEIKKITGQRRTQCSAVIAMHHRRQQQFESSSLGTLEDIVPPHRDGAEAAPEQGFTQRRAFVVGPHQHGDITGQQRVLT